MWFNLKCLSVIFYVRVGFFYLNFNGFNLILGLLIGFVIDFGDGVIYVVNFGILVFFFVFEIVVVIYFKLGFVYGYC